MFKKIISYIDVVVFAIVLFFIDYTVRFYCGLGISKLSILFNLIYISVLSTLLVWLKKKVRIIIEIVITSVFTIICFAQGIHYNFFTSFYRLRKLAVISELMDVTNEAISKIDTRSLFFFIPLILLIVFTVLNKKNKDNKSILFQIVVSIACVVVTISGSLYINNYFKNNSINEDWFGDVYLRDTFYSNIKYYDRFGLYDYFSQDFISLFKSNKNNLNAEETKEIEAFISENSHIEKNEHSGIYEGKNLILISCESLNNFGINEKLTPVLYKMATEGYYFTNFYAPVYQSATSDSEFIALTSMLPSVDYEQTCYAFPSNSYPNALANLFKEKDYDSNSYHANYAQFYNREVFHNSLGFSIFYDMDRLGITFPEYYQEYYNWIKDDLAFDAAIQNTNTNNKFFDFIITTSGHMPYAEKRNDTEENYVIVNGLDEFKDLDTETKCYYAAQMDLDQGLNQLLIDLKDKGVLENTIICLYGDHYPYGVSTEIAQKTVWGSTDTYKMYKTPFIIYDPSSTEGKQIDNLGSTFDIYPTICNLFGLDSENYYKVGKDMFSNEKHYVYFADRSILSDDFYYSANNNEFIKLNEEYSEEEFKSITNKMNDFFKHSQTILMNDYYNK